MLCARDTNCSCFRISQGVTFCGLIKHGPIPYTPQKDYLVIVNPASRLVLDASHLDVQVRPYTGSPFQLWTFECKDIDQTRPGTFLIYNVGTQKLLLVDGYAEHNTNVVTGWNYGQVDLLWSYNQADTTIIHPPSGRPLTIKNWHFDSGTNVVVADRHGGSSQRWNLQCTVQLTGGNPQ